MEIIRADAPENIREQDRLVVGMAQLAPVWLKREPTMAKLVKTAEMAAKNGCQLLVFGEALVPGYPFWVENTDGARFNDPKQKAIYAQYLDQGVVIERGDLNALCAVSKKTGMAIYVGVMERAPDRGGHSLYCTLVHINGTGQIASVHRKLHPTHEERLVWATGDGNGLVVHDLPPFRVGGLNCWENWMPMARTALYAQGEDLHVSVWPGGTHNTADLPLFIAKESRSYVIACSGLMRAEDFPEDTLALAEILSNTGAFLANGGSALAAPDGTFLVEPVVGIEALIIAEIDHAMVRGERQNLDLSGHYARPDVLKLQVNRKRASTVEFED